MDWAFRHSEKEVYKVSKGFKEGFNVIFEVDMSDKLSVLDYSSQILNEIYLPMNDLSGLFQSELGESRKKYLTMEKEYYYFKDFIKPVIKLMFPFHFDTLNI